MTELAFTEIAGEKIRTYVYKDGSRYSVAMVQRICVRPSGSHRLETLSGQKVIVAPGWLAIEVEAEAWSA